MLLQLGDQSRVVTLGFLQGLGVHTLNLSQRILDNLLRTLPSNNPLKNNLLKTKKLLHRRPGQQKRGNNNQSKNLQDESPHKREKLLVMIKDKPIQSNLLQELSAQFQGNNLHLLEETCLLENLQDVGQMTLRLNKKNIVKKNKFRKSKNKQFLIKNHLKKKNNQQKVRVNMG